LLTKEEDKELAKLAQEFNGLLIAVLIGYGEQEQLDKWRDKNWKRFYQLLEKQKA
jgi:hypothetical protein